MVHEVQEENVRPSVYIYFLSLKLRKNGCLLVRNTRFSLICLVPVLVTCLDKRVRCSEGDEDLLLTELYWFIA